MIVFFHVSETCHVQDTPQQQDGDAVTLQTKGRCQGPLNGIVSIQRGSPTVPCPLPHITSPRTFPQVRQGWLPTGQGPDRQQPHQCRGQHHVGGVHRTHTRSTATTTVSGRGRGRISMPPRKGFVHDHHLLLLRQ